MISSGQALQFGVNGWGGRLRQQGRGGRDLRRYSISLPQLSMLLPRRGEAGGVWSRDALLSIDALERVRCRKPRVLLGESGPVQFLCCDDRIRLCRLGSISRPMRVRVPVSPAGQRMRLRCLPVPMTEQYIRKRFDSPYSSP